MTDREFLELAAKAAGHSLCYRKDGAVSIDMINEWNPLADDGDALRLAVRLKIDVKHYNNHVVGWFYDNDIKTVRIFYEGDPYTSTRRAIVRTAAEIGKGMK